MFSLNVNAASKWGKGELQLDDFVVEQFIKYLKGNASKTPFMFAVSVDGKGYMYYYCSSGAACDGGYGQILQECSRYSNDEECFLFARGRTIKWKNGTNPGKGKVSKMSGKWSDTEIKAKLTELGFYKNNNSTSNKTTTPKIAKKIKEGVVYFNQCSWSSDEDEYHWSFEIDSNKKKYLKEVFFAKGDVYNSKLKIILNNEEFIKTKIKNTYDDVYEQYEFNKKKDEISKFRYSDKKGKDKVGFEKLICKDIVGTLNSQ